ncbi:hypothetical protein HAX54_008549 [Datura stramonium]|uniref:Uncharacterized protein n=1 Tax=Datura stramonium TaxID=4076 RepID=A0ABS8RX53_DATST|nr:hypothetical protein [Datura stramonium]
MVVNEMDAPDRGILIISISANISLSSQKQLDNQVSSEDEEIQSIYWLNAFEEAERDGNPILSVSSSMMLGTDMIYGNTETLSYRRLGTSTLHCGHGFSKQVNDELGTCGILSIAITRKRLDSSAAPQDGLFVPYKQWLH